MTDFSIEPLEDRILLSGNVLVSVIGDALFLNGDGESNSLELSTQNNALVVQGNNQTTINGTNAPFEFALEDSPQTLIVFADSGDDQIELNGVVAPNLNVIVFGQQGDDQIRSSDSEIRKLTFFGGDGNDQVGLASLTAGRIGIYGGRGADQVALENTNTDSLTVATHSGDDAIIIEDSETERLALRAGTGDDRLLIENNQVGKSILRLGSGDDFASINENQLNKAVVWGNGGADTISVSTPSDVLIFGGAGSDSSNSEAAFVESNVLDETAITTTRNELSKIAEELLGTETPLPLTLDVTVAEATQSNGVLLLGASDTQQVTEGRRTAVLTGTTLPGAEVSVATGGDGLFDDGNVTANAAGEFQITVELVHNTQNRGLNDVTVRAQRGDDQVISDLPIHFAIGTVTRVETSLGTVDIELLDSDAPTTVDNFLSYFDRFDRSIIHRSPENFVIQGGGFTFENDTINRIATDPPIQGEFLSTNSNLRGTLSMALTSNGSVTNPNSGTSGWFINVRDNARLDNAGHTVFGRVIGDGMNVVDQINQLPALNLTGVTGITALGEIPLLDQSPISGTASMAVGSRTLTGTGTLFTQQLSVGDIISVAGNSFEIVSIPSDTSAEVNRALGGVFDIAAEPVFVVGPPAESDVVFTEFTVLLPTP